MTIPRVAVSRGGQRRPGTRILLTAALTVVLAAGCGWPEPSPPAPRS
jgi:hypothetical protein